MAQKVAKIAETPLMKQYMPTANYNQNMQRNPLPYNVSRI